jgi:class 3 adenylate cyclase
VLTRYLSGFGMALPVALLGMALTAFASLGFLRRRRELDRVAAWLPPAVRERLGRAEPIDFAPSRRLVTILCADLRDFTGLAETLQPDAVAEMLREYLTEMSEVVVHHGGTVVTCAGDCLVAVYNAPFDDTDHAASAVRTALELQERTLQVAVRWEARLGAIVRSGIGIATGEAVVGIMGPQDRQAYTVLGAIADLVSDATRRRLGPDVLGRRLGEVRGPGTSPPVTVHGVLPVDIRKHPRAILEVAATLVLLGAGQTCLVTTRNVGEGGMALGGVPAAWAPGTRVEVRCEGGLLPAALLAEGLIAWRREDEAGITFDGLDPETAPTVAEYVAVRRDR